MNKLSAKKKSKTKENMNLNAEEAMNEGNCEETTKTEEKNCDAGNENAECNQEAAGGMDECNQENADVKSEETAGADGESDSDDSKAQDDKKEENAKKDPKQERIDELEDKVKRQLAEFDNFRKRSEKEKETMFESGARSVIEKLLPIIDNFERGLASVKEEEKDSPHVEGMNMIYKQLMTELEKIDVKPIEAVGCEFNPDFHNAIMQVESDEYESGVIAQELLKGYTYRDTVVRHSMVAVVS
ncbi:MAG: nucleotide exchange factor GrpE [Lachnospiraceae bacterium]|nr:nucleotide exchange factor GrpE [Lachnospiraceae bacterium]